MGVGLGVGRREGNGRMFECGMDNNGESSIADVSCVVAMFSRLSRFSFV